VHGDLYWFMIMYLNLIDLMIYYLFFYRMSFYTHFLGPRSCIRTFSICLIVYTNSAFLHLCLIIFLHLDACYLLWRRVDSLDLNISVAYSYPLCEDVHSLAIILIGCLQMVVNLGAYFIALSINN